MKSKITILLLLWVATHLCAACGSSALAPAGEQAAKIDSTSTAKTPEPRPEPAPLETPEERVARVHKNALVFDAHCDTLMAVVDDDADLGQRREKGHIDLVRAAEGGLDAQVFAVWVAPSFWPNKAKARALEMIDAFHATVAKYPDKMGFSPNVAAAEQQIAQGKLAGFLGIEGGHAIEDDLSALQMFHDKGVRYMTLTWWNNTNWADGSGDEPKWHGLNDLGRKIVKEMNRLGMVVDVSHASEETFWDVLEITTKPVIASHSDTRALADHHRNLTDEQLEALAKNGGVIAINYVAGFLDAEFNRKSDALRDALKPEIEAIRKKYKNEPDRARKESWALYNAKAAELPPVLLDKVIDHIDHAVQVAGIDHVGLGSDFDGFSVGPEELTDASKLPLITGKLLERGYTEADVAKILGQNLLRVFKENIGK